MNASILTHTGIMFDLLRPDPARICLEDITTALSHIGRFTGHGDLIFTDAQHCVLVCDLAPAPLKRWALLHDAAEAYTGDTSGPMKQAMRYLCCNEPSSFDRVYRPIEAAVSTRFGVPVVDVKRWDDEATLIEVGLNGPHSCAAHTWPRVVASRESPAARSVWSPSLAKKMFMLRAARLGIK
jgi:hypothetical protein